MRLCVLITCSSDSYISEKIQGASIQTPIFLSFSTFRFLISELLMDFYTRAALLLLHLGRLPNQHTRILQRSVELTFYVVATS